jgi:hypothetical protein
MKKLSILFLTHLFFASCFAQLPVKAGLPLNVCEGPYVEYRQSQVIVRSIDTNNQVVIDSFPVADKDSHPLSIRFSNHSHWDFTVGLHGKLKNEPDYWKKTDLIIAFSDIEGEFDAFRNLLIANQVIDTGYRWIFGKGHLVVCGDLFDRGNDVAAELWLLYKLEAEAEQSGGYVHTILGNHDIMNLSGDLRYVQPKYMERAKRMGVEYMSLYDANTEFGRWLRSKNLIETIGDKLFLHAGISPEILALQWPVFRINRECRPFYDQGMHPEKFKNSDLWKFFDDGSPFWYRGYFLKPRATQGLVDSTLAFYDVQKIIVGHDIINTVTSFYEGKVMGIDVNEHEGNNQGLLFEDKSYYMVNLTGSKSSIPAN